MVNLIFDIPILIAGAPLAVLGLAIFLRGTYEDFANYLGVIALPAIVGSVAILLPSLFAQGSNAVGFGLLAFVVFMAIGAVLSLVGLVRGNPLG